MSGIFGKLKRSFKSLKEMVLFVGKLGKGALSDWAENAKKALKKEIKSSNDPDYVHMLDLVEEIEKIGPPTPATQKMFNKLANELEEACKLDEKHIISWCDKPKKERHPDTKRRQSQLVAFKF